MAALLDFTKEGIKEVPLILFDNCIDTNAISYAHALITLHTRRFAQSIADDELSDGLIDRGFHDDLRLLRDAGF